MKKVIFQMSVSLDGYIEGANREIDWHLVDDEFNAYAVETSQGSSGSLEPSPRWPFESKVPEKALSLPLAIYSPLLPWGVGLNLAHGASRLGNLCMIG